MDVGTVFKYSLYGLTAFVGTILGLSEGEGAVAGTTRAELFLPFGSIPVAILGYLLTERSKRAVSGSGGSGLSAIWANSFGIIALIATAYEFTRENRESKLLAGTHLLLYATWIVLFQQKTIRSYWFLMALGILQLSIASVLTRSGWFGFAAVIYLFAAVWTLSIFSLWRAEQLFEQENQEDSSDELLSPGASLNASGTMRKTSDVRGTIQHEGGTHWLTSRFVTGVLTTAFAALVVSTAFFAFIPRVWVGSDFAFQEDLDRLAGINRKTGAPSTVKLGNLSSTLESAEKVFEIQITRPSTKEKIPVQKYAEVLGLSEPLFRASIMTTYDKGNWTVDRTLDYLVPGVSFPRRGLNSEDSVRQDIHTERAEPGPLYCLGRPLIAIYGKQLIAGGYLESTGIITRGDNTATDYAVLSRMPTQQRTHFKVNVPPDLQAQYKNTEYLKLNTRLPAELTRLKALAEEVVQIESRQRNKLERNTESRGLTDLEKASAIEYFLRESGQYVYSLDSSVEDSRIDPVEDFLFNRKAGHCEYFATALALMLRAVGIPARIVTGYKGGIEHGNDESTSSRMYSFEVQKRYAHMWTEAWVDPPKSTEKGWTTFDATPSDGRSLSIADLSTKKPTMWTGMTSRLSTLWSESILNLSLERQEASIYKPLREFGLSVATFAYDFFESPGSVLDTFWEILQNRKQWFSIEGGFLAFVILMGLAALVWFLRKMIGPMTAHANKQQRQRIIKFYERFLTLMKQKGMNREADQTQQEFAAAVTAQFRLQLAENHLMEVPDEISRFFYRVRFGEEELSSSELLAMEETLTSLERVLEAHEPHRSERIGSPLK